MESALEDKKKQVTELTASFSVVKDAHAATSTSLANAEELLQTLLTGLSSSNTAGGGYMGQLAEARARHAQAQAEEEQCRTKLAMAEKEQKALEVRWKAVEREAGEGRKNLENMRAEVEKLKKKVTECGWSAEKEKQFDVDWRTAKEDLRQAAEVCTTSCCYLFDSNNCCCIGSRYDQTPPLNAGFQLYLPLP